MPAPSLLSRAPTHILLIRHAQSAPSDDVPEAQWPLSPKGVQQALALAEAGSLQRVVHIYSSPYRRAIDTVAPLATRLGLTVTAVPELRERKLTDVPRDGWEHLLRQAWANHDFALAGAESGRTAQARMHEALLGLALRHPGERLAVASHGNAIALLLNLLDPGFGFDEWKAMRNPDIFSVTWYESGWRRNALAPLQLSL